MTTFRLTATVTCACLAAIGLSVTTHAADSDLDPTFGAGGRVITDFGGDDLGHAMALQADGKIVIAGLSFASGYYNFALARHQPGGSLDTTFGTGGKVTTSFPVGFAAARAVAIQADGKIIAAGVSEPRAHRDFTLVRYKGDGSIDSTFGTGGIVTTDFGAWDEANAIIIQADGRIVVAGASAASGTFDFALARYNVDGTLDATFGAGGKVTTNFGQLESANSIAIQPDGRIVVAGLSDADGSRAFALARYTANGSLDFTFGPGGTVTTHFNASDAASAVSVQPDGAIVAAGWTDVDGTFNDNNFALARYDSHGALDAGFGVGGKVTTDFGGRDQVFAMTIQPDGRIIAAGYATSIDHDFALARYDVDGSLDATFGLGGTVSTDFAGSSDDRSFAVAIQPDGRIVAAGLTGTGGPYDFALARYGTPPEGTTVSIDIKPGSFPNSIRLGSGGNVPVAIFSAANFDATGVDPLTVTLASAPVQLKGKGTPMSSYEDVNGDGLLDLVVHVDASALALAETDTSAVLEGSTYGGQAIHGGDTVRVVP